VRNYAALPQAKNHVHGACRERLIREIIRVEGVSPDPTCFGAMLVRVENHAGLVSLGAQGNWEEAMAKVEKMNKENDEGSWVVTFPYKARGSPACSQNAMIPSS
jgi:hypothetical protein